MMNYKKKKKSCPRPLEASESVLIHNIYWNLMCCFDMFRTLYFILFVTVNETCIWSIFEVKSQLL